MANYIDRQKLVMTISSTISEVARESPYDRVWFSRMAARQAEIINIIYDMPAADVVEIVRCKDCRYYCINDDICAIAEAHDFNLDDFCSYGERREDGQTDH